MQPPSPSLEPIKSGDAPGGADGRGRLIFGFPKLPGWKGELLIIAFFALATVVLTWPIAITMDKATGLRGDYFNNIWNVWWLRHSILEGHSPFWTDYLYYPDGLSLKRHTLSATNALMGVFFRSFLGPHATFNAILLITFAFSAWAFSLFARYLTGSLAGAILAGLIYSFNPFHYFYICQVNVFSFQWLPLILLYFVRTYREGGVKNMALAAVFTGLMAATVEYYIIYAAMTVGLMLVFGKLIDRDVRAMIGARRLMIAGVLTVIAVGIAAAPLIIGTFGAESELEGRVTMGLQKRRSNDLLGFYWIGGPEVATVSWMTMVGYSTLLIILAGIKRVFRFQSFWLIVGLLFAVLSLGNTLVINGENTEIPLLYTWLQKVPGLNMLRKPDRSFYVVMFVVALCAAEAWTAISARLRTASMRRGAWAFACVLTMAELTGVPFNRYDYEAPAYFETLAEDDSVKTVFEMPPMQIDVINARYNFFQTVHEKKQPLGYCTALALHKLHHDRMETIVNTYFPWVSGRGRTFPRLITQLGVDRVIMHKKWTLDRPYDHSLQRTFFAPFAFVKKRLIEIRQTGQYLDVPLEQPNLQNHKALLFREFGKPIYEDDEVVVYDAQGESQ